MEGLQHGVQRHRTFRSVQHQRALGGLDQLGLLRLEDARSARVLGLPVAEISSLAWGSSFLSHPRV